MNENISIETFKRFISEFDPGAPGRSGSLIAPVLKELQGRWKNGVLFEMSRRRSIRFIELKKALPGITNTMLSSTLRELEYDGFVDRMQLNEIPPHVEYSLTDKGKELIPVWYELFKWGMKYVY